MTYRRGRWVIVLVTALAGLTPSLRADAECVYAVVYITREDDSPIYVAGEDDPCLTETDYYQEIFVPTDGGTEGLPDGTPNGYFVDLRVPVP